MTLDRMPSSPVATARTVGSCTAASPAPLPAVITCISTTATARRAGHAVRLVEAICDDLAGRGFAAVEAYTEASAHPDATSAATPGFWCRCGFDLAVDDDRYPVVRRELS
jgi:ribosomal protein S18 acetylase RimI-like enzyme